MSAPRQMRGKRVKLDRPRNLFFSNYALHMLDEELQQAGKKKFLEWISEFPVNDGADLTEAEETHQFMQKFELAYLLYGLKWALREEMPNADLRDISRLLDEADLDPGQLIEALCEAHPYLSGADNAEDGAEEAGEGDVPLAQTP